MAQGLGRKATKLSSAVVYRQGGPAASAGQCPAGCERPVSPPGGDREAGGPQGPGGGTGTVLHLHRISAAGGGRSLVSMVRRSSSRDWATDSGPRDSPPFVQADLDF